jgi:sucrose-6-phosphate hydrolase SacC (GH32 family)
MKYLLAIAASAITSLAIAQSSAYKENYRPQFHFSPEKNWINDPNGLFIKMELIICFTSIIHSELNGVI